MLFVGKQCFYYVSTTTSTPQAATSPKSQKKRVATKRNSFFFFFRGFVAFSFHSTVNRNNVALHFVPLTVQGRTSPAFDCGKSLSLLNKLPTPICFLLENSVFTMFQQQPPHHKRRLRQSRKRKELQQNATLFSFSFEASSPFRFTVQ